MAGVLLARAHVTAPKTVLLNLAPMHAVSVLSVRCNQLQLHAMTD